MDKSDEFESEEIEEQEMNENLDKEYDDEGYDKEGYNKQGFNREGYNKKGYDKEGFDKNNINIWGIRRDLKDEFGNSIFDFEINKEENNEDEIENIDEIKEIIEYDENGYTSYGEPKIKFDISDYLEIETINPDKEKNDEESIFADSNLCESENDLSVGKTIFHRDKGEAEIINIDNGYIKVKYKLSNNTAEFNIKSFGEYISITPFASNIRAKKSFNKNDKQEEDDRLEKTIYMIENNLKNKLKKKLENKYNKLFEKSSEYTLLSGVAIKKYKYGKQIENDFDTIFTKMKKSPYFARVKIDGEDFYISKTEVEAPNIIDWRDKRTKYYYQYQIHKRGTERKLKLVRDLMIDNSRLQSYTDKYNIEKNIFDNLDDRYFEKKLENKRKNKYEHDIIDSIREEQHEIITYNYDKDIVVQGCAGSGKSMVLIHRLSQILYEKDINAKDIYIISPTDYLRIQSKNLAQSPAIKLEEANSILGSEMYADMVKSYYGINGIYNVVDFDYDKDNDNNAELYSLDVLKDKVKMVRQILSFNTIERSDFINKCKIKISKELDKLNKNFSEDEFLLIKEYYKKFYYNCREYSEENIIDFKNEIRKDIFKERKLIAISKILTFLFENNAFIKESTKQTQMNSVKLVKKLEEIDDISDLLNTYRALDIIVANINLINFNNYINKNRKADAILFLIEELHKNDIEVSKKRIYKIFNFLSNKSEDFAIAILEGVEKRKNILKRLESIENITDKIVKLDFIGLDKNENKNYREFFNPIRQIDEILNKINLDILNLDINGRKNNILEFMKYYTDLLYFEKYLVEFENGLNNKIVFNAISYVVNNELDLFDAKVKTNWQKFAHAYICSEVYGKLDIKKRYIFVDEFQDFSLVELKLIKNVYPNAVLNFYGDIKQCISKKGIKLQTEFSNINENIEIKNINLNCRNAKQITQFINNKFNMKMEYVDIDGVVSDLNLNNLEKFKVKKDDRIVYIVKDIKDIDYRLMSKLGIIEGWKCPKSEFYQGVPIALTIQDLKGLEFEVAIVDDNNMTDNEKYVAYTRALRKLYLYAK